jgi:hypothetical protein
MDEPVLRALTPHERGVIEPELARLRELEGAAARQRTVVERMLSLVEPRFASPGGGVRFDPERLAFVGADADGGAGPAG